MWMWIWMGCRIRGRWERVWGRGGRGRLLFLGPDPGRGIWVGARVGVLGR